MSKIKVLQFPIQNNGSGITQYILNNWDVIDKSRFQFDFATLNSTIDFEEALAAQGCQVHHISCSAEENPAVFESELAAIYRRGYDAVHLHTSYWKSFAVEEIAKKAGVPIVIIHAHNTDVGAVNDGRTVAEAVGWHNHQKARFDPALATHYLACSRAAADWLYGPQIPVEKIQIHNNAIDVGRFAFNERTRQARRRDLRLDGKFVIGHVGRFVYQKNHSFLLDMFAEVSGDCDNAVLMLIGIGGELEAMRDKARRMGLADKVLFLGKRADVADLYQAMDLFALPSRFEGLGIVLVEAQCAGLPCLVSDAVPPQAKITDMFWQLPLELTAWVPAVRRAVRAGIPRRDHSREVAAAGYSAGEQVRVLEDIYSGKSVKSRAKS